MQNKIPEEFVSVDGVSDWKEFGVTVALEGLKTISSCRGLKVGSIFRRGEPNNLHATKDALYADWLLEVEASLEKTGELAMVFMDGDGTEKIFRRAHRELPRQSRHVIADPIFLDSKTSQLVQMADHIAWSANASLMRVPKHEFAHNWYRDYLAPRDPFRAPREL